MIHELNHVGIATRDLDAALAFYERLDARAVFEDVIPGPGTRVVYLQIGDGLVELLCTPDPPADAAFGINHVAFLSDDLDGDHDRLVAAGCRDAVAPRVAGTGIGRLAFVERDGARIELLQRDLPLRRPVDPDGLVAALDHYALTATDLAAAAVFFTRVVGMEPVEDRTLDGAVVRHVVGLGSDRLGLEARDDATAAFPRITLRVDDVDRALAELGRRGLEDLGAARDSRFGTGRVAFLDGPDGVTIELLDREPAAPTPGA